MKKMHLLIIANLFIGTINLHGMEKHEKKSPVAHLQSLATLVTNFINGEKTTPPQPTQQQPAQFATQPVSAPIDIKLSNAPSDNDLNYDSSDDDSSGFSSKDSSYVLRRTGNNYIDDFYGINRN